MDNIIQQVSVGQATEELEPTAVETVKEDPELKEYWLYDKDGYYTGKSVKAKNKPDNSFQFKPHDTVPEGMASKFDGHGWTLAKDTRTMVLDQVKTEMLWVLNQAVTEPPSPYTDVERNTFAQQLEEARVFKQTGEIGVTLLHLIESRSETAEQLVDKILAKHEEAVEAKAAYLVRIQKARLRITSAKARKDIPTEDELRKILIQ